MISAFRNIRDRLRGGGDYAITVPPMDGTLRPNTDLENAEVLISTIGPDHLQQMGGDLWFSSGKSINRLGSDGQSEVVSTYNCAITAFALDASGQAAVALADGTLQLPGLDNVTGLAPAELRCVTAMTIDAAGDWVIAIGSSINPADQWPRDLMERNRAGSIWRIDGTGAASLLAKDLGWPTGLLSLPTGDILILEASRSRVIRLSGDQINPVLSNLPGYPAGLSATDGGYHLCIMAPRNQLIEFMLRETEFVRDMLDTTPPDCWIAPSLYPPQSFLEPLQGGAMKQLGIMKPWAPSRSAGLVVKLDAEFVPKHSHHSRADGRNHGTTSCVEWAGHLVVASRGNNCLLCLPIRGAS
jgi:hypothetical protein